ncbi:MAG TPA: septal ring lytic transglycosylase RlpA family protein [Solirubrobacteraceae bacterium]|jgi:rare lipoprotein A (peptidoglycan hydrolase)|nr:septal ring lytic transglycosylase RlpA family protein [Solirubrobacteraceae bacterium]
MTRRHRRHAHAVPALLAAALALPAAALAASGGGAGVSPGGSPVTTTSGTSTTHTTTTGTTTTGPAPSVQSGDVTVSTSGDGITLQTTASGILRKELIFSGNAPSQLAGQTIQIQRSGHQTNWSWANTVTATINQDGSFNAVWQTDHIGQFAMRAVVSGTSSTQAEGASMTPSLTTTVYRPSRATEYGPGFYGKKTACGQHLRRGMIGLANRTLRCGESVAIYYRGKTLVVPVIDRGPYANGADWDLTVATGKALGIGGTAQIDAVSLPQR